MRIAKQGDNEFKEAMWYVQANGLRPVKREWLSQSLASEAKKHQENLDEKDPNGIKHCAILRLSIPDLLQLRQASGPQRTGPISPENDDLKDLKPFAIYRRTDIAVAVNEKDSKKDNDTRLLVTNIVEPEPYDVGFIYISPDLYISKSRIGFGVTRKLETTNVFSEAAEITIEPLDDGSGYYRLHALDEKSGFNYYVGGYHNDSEPYGNWVMCNIPATQVEDYGDLVMF